MFLKRTANSIHIYRIRIALVAFLSRCNMPTCIIPVRWTKTIKEEEKLQLSTYPLFACCQQLFCSWVLCYAHSILMKDSICCVPQMKRQFTLICYSQCNLVTRLCAAALILLKTKLKASTNVLPLACHHWWIICRDRQMLLRGFVPYGKGGRIFASVSRSAGGSLNRPSARVCRMGPHRVMGNGVINNTDLP